MDGCISWKWVSFISHQKCVIQDVLKMTGEEVSQPSYSGVLSCVRKSVCILWLQTDQVSVAPHKGQRLEETNQTKQHECSTGAERGTKHGAHDKCWLSGPSPGHAADCAHPHTSPGPHTTWSRGCGHPLLCCVLISCMSKRVDDKQTACIQSLHLYKK